MKQLQARWATDLGLGANPVAQFGAPVSFSASLDSITPGQTQVLNTSGLANGFRTPYVIDEIRMQGYMAAESATVLQPSYALQFQFRTGVYAFSAAPIPMLLYGPRFAPAQDAAELYGGSGPGSFRGPMLVSEFAGGAMQVGDEVRWHLPKPLWMAPGDQVQCSVFRHATAAASGNAAFAANVTYVGRSLKPGTPGPRVRSVPWVAHYIHDIDDAFSQTTTQFRNPFTIPLQVQRLTGRPLSKAASGVFETSGPLGTLPFYANGNNKYASIYIEDSLGYKVTRDFTPVGSVFDTERCAWTFSRPLGPREQFNMQFRTVGANEEVTDVIFGVGMIGYREETA